LDFFGWIGKEWKGKDERQNGQGEEEKEDMKGRRELELGRTDPQFRTLV